MKIISAMLTDKQTDRQTTGENIAALSSLLHTQNDTLKQVRT